MLAGLYHFDSVLHGDFEPPPRPGELTLEKGFTLTLLKNVHSKSHCYVLLPSEYAAC